MHTNATDTETKSTSVTMQHNARKMLTKSYYHAITCHQALVYCKSKVNVKQFSRTRLFPWQFPDNC